MADRAKVRAALADLIYDADLPDATSVLAGLIGVEHSNDPWTLAERVVDALLAASTQQVARPLRGENPCGCVAELVTEPVIRYVETCEKHILKLEGMRTVGPDSPAVFRATPPSAGEVQVPPCCVCGYPYTRTEHHSSICGKIAALDRLEADYGK